MDDAGDSLLQLHLWSLRAVDRNGSKKFRKDCFVKGAKRRLRRSKTLDKTILSKHTPAVAIDGFL
jgi:hypothetical protein